MRCGAVEGGKGRAPCLADLSQLSNSAALLHKISTTEWTSLGHQFGGGYIATSKLLICAATTRQDLT
jgi:hypothetical protein